jgi:hypothetical protein
LNLEDQYDKSGQKAQKLIITPFHPVSHAVS